MKTPTSSGPSRFSFAQTWAMVHVMDAEKMLLMTRNEVNPPFSHYREWLALILGILSTVGDCCSVAYSWRAGFDEWGIQDSEGLLSALEIQVKKKRYCPSSFKLARLEISSLKFTPSRSLCKKKKKKIHHDFVKWLLHGYTLKKCWETSLNDY